MLLFSYLTLPSFSFIMTFYSDILCPVFSYLSSFSISFFNPIPWYFQCSDTLLCHSHSLLCPFLPFSPLLSFSVFSSLLSSPFLLSPVAQVQMVPVWPWKAKTLTSGNPQRHTQNTRIHRDKHVCSHACTWSAAGIWTMQTAHSLIHSLMFAYFSHTRNIYTDSHCCSIMSENAIQRDRVCLCYCKNKHI